MIPFASFSFAALPKAVLYGVPAGLAVFVAAIVYYEYKKKQVAAANAASAAQLSVAAQAAAPARATGPAPAALTPGMHMINGKMTWVMSANPAANQAFFDAVNAQTAAAKG